MKKYIALAIVVVAVYFCQSFFNATGGIGADSLSYFGIASDLPHLKTNLFPLGFPVLIELFHLIFQDYFWAAKIMNITLILIILLFSYFQKFYFRETVLLFTGKTLFLIFNFVLSESLFVSLLYFLIYLFHERFHDRMKPPKFIALSSLILVLLLTVRYSGIYIYAGVGVYWVFYFLKKKSSVITRDLLKVLIFSGIGIAAYLSFNYYTFGSFTGENLRGAPAHYIPIYVFRDIMGITTIFDPFIGIKPASNSFASITFQVLLMFFDLFLLWLFIRLVKKKKHLVNLAFHQFLWMLAGVYTVTVFISGYFQQIEEMNSRMLAASTVCLFFSFLLIYFKNLKSDRLIFGIGCFFLFFSTAYLLKIPSNYFNNRKQIEVQMPKFIGKKYLYNDEKVGKEVLTNYHIPIINKSFQYKHTGNQQGDIKYSIAGTINPQIKWLKYDTIKKKSEVLYSSELTLK